MIKLMNIINELEINKPTKIKDVSTLIKLLQKALRSDDKKVANWAGTNLWIKHPTNYSNLEYNWMIIMSTFHKFKYPGPHIISYEGFLEKFTRPQIDKFGKIIFSKLKYPLTEHY